MQHHTAEEGQMRNGSPLGAMSKFTTSTPPPPTVGAKELQWPLDSRTGRSQPIKTAGGQSRRGFHSEILSLFLLSQTAKSHLFHLLKMPGSSWLGNKRECSQGREAALTESALHSAAGASEVRLGSGEKAGWGWVLAALYQDWSFIFVLFTFCCCDTHHDHRHLGEVRDYLASCPDYRPLLKDVKAELNHEQTQEPQEKSASWLASSDLFNPSDIALGHLPRDGTPNHGLGLLHQLTTKKMSHRHDHWRTWSRRFFSWGSLFLKDLKEVFL